MVKGGTKSNVIPDSCELIVDTRWVPRHGTAFVENGLNSMIASLKRKDPTLDARVELMYDSPSLKLPESHPAVRLAESISGHKSEVAPYGTEAALYAKHGIPSIVLGPGNLKQAHIVDEFVQVSRGEEGALHLHEDDRVGLHGVAGPQTKAKALPMRNRIPAATAPISSVSSPLLRGFRFTMRPFHSPATKRKIRDTTTETTRAEDLADNKR